MEKLYPRNQTVYTVEQIDQLTLGDLPFLMIELDGDYFPIQHHLDKVGKILKGLEFRYIRTTDEWIPIFHCVNPLEDVKKLVEFSVDVDPYIRPGTECDFWLTIKSHPEKPHYRLTSRGDIEDLTGKRFQMTPSLLASIERAKVRLAKALG